MSKPLLSNDSFNTIFWLFDILIQQMSENDSLDSFSLENDSFPRLESLDYPSFYFFKLPFSFNHNTAV